MSGPSTVASTPLTHRNELIEFLSSGCKPKDAWRIGTEHEKFGFRLDDLRPPTYDGPQGIAAMLEGLAELGWKRVEEHGKLPIYNRIAGTKVGKNKEANE